MNKTDKKIRNIIVIGTLCIAAAGGILNKLHENRNLCHDPVAIKLALKQTYGKHYTVKTGEIITADVDKYKKHVCIAAGVYKGKYEYKPMSYVVQMMANGRVYVTTM